MKKITLLIIIIILSLNITACKSNELQEIPKENNQTLENISQKEESRISVLKTETVDYSDLFQSIEGCAVFYDEDKKTLNIYNEENCRIRYSPYSTFKIPAALIGLENNVLESEETKMNYSGDKYFFDTWNKDLTLKEAFSVSCVWYFRQVIDKIGQENMQKALNEINYGNCDISQWEGNPINEQSDTNGFWLGSSLKITPIEQVEVLENIFENKTNFSSDSIAILKNIMYCDNINNVSVYGKTGSGKDNSAWFTGFVEKDSKNTYFAVHLEDKNAENIAGAKAKEIAYLIIEKYFS